MTCYVRCSTSKLRSCFTSREVWSAEKAIKQRPSGENFLRKQGGFSTLTTVKLGKRFWWKQRTRYQWAPGRPEEIRRLSRRWTTFWFSMCLGFRVSVSSSIAVVREQLQMSPFEGCWTSFGGDKQLHHSSGFIYIYLIFKLRIYHGW